VRFLQKRAQLSRRSAIRRVIFAAAAETGVTGLTRITRITRTTRTTRVTRVIRTDLTYGQRS